MPRKRPETKRSKIAKMLIEEYQPQNAQDIQEALKDLLGDTMEELLKAELDEHLDYEYGQKPLSLNTRNGSSKKIVKSSYGNIDLSIPRDRKRSFEPQALRKYEKDILIVSTDNLPGFSKAIESVYPKAEIHPKSVGKIMYNPPNKKLNKVCIIQRHKRINQRPKSSIQSINRRLSLNKFRNLWREME